MTNNDKLHKFRIYVPYLSFIHTYVPDTCPFYVPICPYLLLCTTYILLHILSEGCSLAKADWAAVLNKMWKIHLKLCEREIDCSWADCCEDCSLLKLSKEPPLLHFERDNPYYFFRANQQKVDFSEFRETDKSLKYVLTLIVTCVFMALW